MIRTSALNCAGMLLCLAVVGCRSVPFEPEPLASFHGRTAADVSAAFDERVGVSFEAIESVVFGTWGRELTGMGFLVVDGSLETYHLACMTPAGIKLLELYGEGDAVEVAFAPPGPSTLQERIPTAVAADIRRIYLSWSPGPGATGTARDHDVVIREKLDSGVRVEYTYAGPRGVLVKKRFRGRFRRICDVEYYDYRCVDGLLFPHGIVLRNKEHHYTLTIRVRSLELPMDSGRSDEECD